MFNIKLALKNKVYLASTWVIGGYILALALRLGGNLILTRMLVPEFFGVMAIAQVFILGLWFFSDIGIGVGVIRSKRSNDTIFLNTAWTLQVIRGVILWLLSLVIAGPFANIYDNQILTKIIPIIGSTFVISSFSSTSSLTLNKKIQLGKITTMELVSQFSGLVCMVSLAYTYRSVWALIAGALCSAVIKTLWSHFLESGARNRFALEMEAVHELTSFGKWIFVSTALMFLATQADRLLLGKFFSLSLFGVYNIAAMLAELPKQILGQLSEKIIFPLMTNYAGLPRKEFRLKILQKRKQVLAPMVLLVAIFSCFGDTIIFLLYDARYHQAAWMLPLLAVGMWPYVLCASIDRCFFALGKPKFSAMANFCKFLYMYICVPIMYHSFGILGGVLAVAMNDVPVYIVNSIGLQMEDLSCFRQDTFYTLILVTLITIFLGARVAYGMGIPEFAVQWPQ